MPAEGPLMEPAPAAPKSSLEIMLDTIRERDEQRRDDGEFFLPPSPARPRGRGRPPTSARWPLPAGFKVRNSERTFASTVAGDKKPDVGNGNSRDTESPCTRAEGGITISDGVVHPAIETVIDDAASPDSEEQCICAQGSGKGAYPTLSHNGMVKLTQDGEDDTVMWINNGAIDIVDSAEHQDSESEISVEAVSVSSSSGSSRESEPEKRTKAGVGKLLWGSTSCVRAPVAAVAWMVLNSCGSSSSGVHALEEQTDQGAERSLHYGTMKSVPGGGGDTDVSTVKASAASSMSRSGVAWRWLKKISCRLSDARDVEEMGKAGIRQRKSRSTAQPWIN